MAGIDNIIKEILQEAQGKADKVIEEAKLKADALKAEAAKADEKLTSQLKAGADRQAKELAQRAVSQGALRKRQAVLKARQDIIDGVIEKAYLQLSTRDDEAYFSMIRKLIEKNLRAGKGEVCFNETDLKRIPAGFEESIAKSAAKAGGTLTISEVPVKIRSGCIIAYGGIEENCSLEAIFAEKRDALRDLANSVLW